MVDEASAVGSIEQPATRASVELCFRLMLLKERGVAEGKRTGMKHV